jgi:hypothetical protein
MKILHITYHQGCKINIDYVCKQLGYEVITQCADWNYNIGHSRAEEIWNKYKDYYNSFDTIITSDTAPLSRIFLQNNYQGNLIIWVCNRFDYADQASNDCKFPDPEYYQLIKRAKDNKNVKIFSYTKFEHEYAQKYRGFSWDPKVIKPCSFYDNSSDNQLLLNGIDRESTFFIPPYHNDTIFMNLKEKCDELGIKTYSGRYNGPTDLKGIRGIIHIPYAWSNLALFENWSLGNIYFIPSKDFLIKLMSRGNFFWSPPFPIENIESSEWYLPEHEDLFVYFDNWEELKNFTENDNLIKKKKDNILKFIETHNNKILNKWKDAFNNW